MLLSEATQTASVCSLKVTFYGHDRKAVKYYLMEIEGDSEDSKAHPNPRITVRENKVVVEEKVLWSFL